MYFDSQKKTLILDDLSDPDLPSGLFEISVSISDGNSFPLTYQVQVRIYDAPSFDTPTAVETIVEDQLAEDDLLG